MNQDPKDTPPNEDLPETRVDYSDPNKAPKWRKFLWIGLALWAAIIVGLLIGMPKGDVDRGDLISQEEGQIAPEDRIITTTDEPEGSSSKVKIGQKAPGFTLKGREGNFGLSDVKGKITFIEFFNSRCPHCRNIAPTLEKALNKRPDIEFVQIAAAREPEERVNRWFDNFLDKPMSGRLVYDDQDLRVTHMYGVPGYPTFVLINSDGTVENIISGEYTEEELARIFKKAK